MHEFVYPKCISAEIETCLIGQLFSNLLLSSVCELCEQQAQFAVVS